MIAPLCPPPPIEPLFASPLPCDGVYIVIDLAPTRSQQRKVECVAAAGLANDQQADIEA